MSYIDPTTGELVYESSDARGPMHVVLNLGQNASRLARQSDRQRLDALEQRFAGMDASTPWVDVPREAAFQATPDAGPLLAQRRRGEQIYVDGVLKSGPNVVANFSMMGRMPVNARPLRPIFTLARNTNGGDVVRVNFRTDGWIQLFGTVPANCDVTFVPLQFFTT